jgi:hypothetical protein
MVNRRNDADAALRRAKAAGLRVEMLTPLERGACEQLLGEVAQK